MTNPVTITGILAHCGHAQLSLEDDAGGVVVILDMLSARQCDQLAPLQGQRVEIVIQPNDFDARYAVFEITPGKWAVESRKSRFVFGARFGSEAQARREFRPVPEPAAINPATRLTVQADVINGRVHYTPDLPAAGRYHIGDVTLTSAEDVTENIWFRFKDTRRSRFIIQCRDVRQEVMPHAI